MDNFSQVLWLTGLSGSGKSTFADHFQQYCAELNIDCVIIDGDIFRREFSQDLGFSEQDRHTNITRMAQHANKLLTHHQLVIVAAISPLAASRQAAKDIIGEENFCEIFIDTPLEVCEQRDPKGLYKKARSGEVLEFTGISSPYQAPLNPDITLSHSQPLTANIQQVAHFSNSLHRR